MSSLGKIRIIGGKWRGRKIDVVNADGLRPSPDRTRETLFNWLQGKIKGARCLDLFAGSGILGFEALSRGASEVLTVELNTIIAGSLRKTSKILQSDAHKIVCQDALSIAEENLGNFDTENCAFSKILDFETEICDLRKTWKFHDQKLRIF